jgi:hypothetical protein
MGAESGLQVLAADLLEDYVKLAPERQAPILRSQADGKITTPARQSGEYGRITTREILCTVPSSAGSGLRR